MKFYAKGNKDRMISKIYDYSSVSLHKILKGPFI